MQKVEIRTTSGRHIKATGIVVGETKTLFKIKIETSCVDNLKIGETISVKKVLDKNHTILLVA